MTSTKPAHVFISNSLDAVRKYFDRGTEYLSHEAVAAMASDPGIFFGSPTKNSTILSLSHQVSQGADGENSNSQILMDVIDPSFSFEEEIQQHMRLATILAQNPPTRNTMLKIHYVEPFQDLDKAVERVCL